MIKVSVVIPVYNVEKYLSSCIESVVAQNFKDYEIICVDDGSTDKSSQILDEYAKKYHFIKVIHQKNMGQAEARNVGVKNSSGEYLLFLDSDDCFETGTLSELYENAEKNKTDIIYFDAQCVFESEDLYDKAKENYYIRDKCYGINTGKELFSRLINDNCFTDSACLMFYKKEFLIKNNIEFIKGMIYEDCYFSVLCFMRANVVQHINKRYYLYTVHHNSTMTSDQFKFKNLYSRLICFRKFSELYFNEKFSNSQKLAFIKLINKTKNYVNHIYNNLNNNELDKFLKNVDIYDYLYDFEVCNVNLNKIFNIPKMKDLINLLKKNRTITIYGAGIRAKRLYTFLKINEPPVDIKNFLVSARNNNPQSLFGVPVCSLSEGYLLDEEDFVLIAVQNRTAVQMTENLKKQDFRNYFVVDDELNSMIVEKLKEII